MDMRDWYKTAFKSSLHGYVGMTIGNTLSKFDEYVSSKMKGKEITTKDEVSKLIDLFDNMQVEQKLFLNSASPEPAVREASGGLEMARDATPDQGFAQTPDRDYSPAPEMGDAPGGLEVARSATPQGGFEMTPELGGPEIGSYYMAGSRFVKILGPPTLDPELDILGQAYPVVPVEMDGKRVYHALSGYSNQQPVAPPKLKRGKQYTWSHPVTGNKMKVTVERVRFIDGKEYGFARDATGKKRKIRAWQMLPGVKAQKAPLSPIDPAVEKRVRKILAGKKTLDFDPKIHDLPYVRKYARKEYDEAVAEAMGQMSQGSQDIKDLSVDQLRGEHKQLVISTSL